MKKIICLLLALLLAAGTLSGCHGTLVPDTTAAQTEAPGETKESIPGETKESEAAPAEDKSFKVPESFDTSRKFELTFWLKNDSNSAQVAIYQKAMDDFTALYPNITFKVKKYPKPLAWVKINGKKISLTKNKLGYDCNNYKKTSITVDFKVSADWKVQYLDGAKIRDDEYRDFTWKKGKAVKLAADQRAILDIALINNKTGDEFFYMIFVNR